MWAYVVRSLILPLLTIPHHIDLGVEIVFETIFKSDALALRVRGHGEVK